MSDTDDRCGFNPHRSSALNRSLIPGRSVRVTFYAITPVSKSILRAQMFAGDLTHPATALFTHNFTIKQLNYQMYLKSFILLVVSLSYVSIHHLAEGLQCYSCSGEDTNDNCIGSNNIQTCSITQDRCLTQVTYSKERGKLGIDKSCASVEGCTAATLQLSKYYFCAKSRAGWGCVECCPEDRCNESRGVNIHQRSWISLMLISMGIVLFHEMCS